MEGEMACYVSGRRGSMHGPEGMPQEPYEKVLSGISDQGRKGGEVGFLTGTKE